MKLIPLSPLALAATVLVGASTVPISPAFAAYPNVKTTQSVVQGNQPPLTKQAKVPGPEYVLRGPNLPFAAITMPPRFDVAGWAFIKW